MGRGSNKNYRIAYFISPHGFGHAARAAAIMDALTDIEATIEFDIFTTIPEWFFENSLRKPFAYHHTLTDIGLVQKTPFEEDFENTLKRLSGLLPYDGNRIESLATSLSDRQCNMILCDISPMGIAVGEASGIPSVLVENFTWDWIYEAYTSSHPGFKRFIEYLKELFDQATHHIQTEPVCNRKRSDRLFPPISRKPRTSRETIRNHLSIPQDASVVMITMGGIPRQYAIQDMLMGETSIHFIVSGGNEPFQQTDNVVILPHQSEFYHPDLIHASDLVIGKAGYSTLAEVYDAGIPFIFVKRPTFRESGVMTTYIKKRMSSIDISEKQFEKGDWISRIADMLQSPRNLQNKNTGAQHAAEYIHELLAQQ